MIGQSFGRLKVISIAQNKGAHRAVTCVCDCGRSQVVRRTYLTNGVRTACRACSAAQATHKRVYKRSAPRDLALTAAFYNYQTNARKRDLAFLLTRERFAEIVTAACIYCGVQPDDNSIIGVDRRDNDQGYNDHNAVSCCSICNMAKRTLSFQQFMDWINRLIEHQQRVQT